MLRCERMRKKEKKDNGAGRQSGSRENTLYLAQFTCCNPCVLRVIEKTEPGEGEKNVCGFARKRGHSL